MKRLLSVVLAIMMVATLLPMAVFATEGEVANAGYTIKYDISGFMDANNYGWNANGTWLTDMSFENTNGFFDFHSSSIGNAETVDSKLRCNGNNQIQIGSGTVVFFEIYVPVSGTYTMYINHKKASNGNTASVYMNQGDAPSNAWNYQIGYLNSKSDTEELNARSAVTSDSAFTTPAQIELAAGYHYLTFKCPSYSWIGTIELVSGDGSQTVLTSMKTSIDKNVLAVGDEAAKMSVDSFWLSDATVAEGKTYVITYSSGDESVARVNSSTGEITAVGEGKTEITATATNEAGVEITASEDVVVADGAIIKYDIVGHIKELGYKEVSDVTYSLEGFTEDVTDGFYSFFPGSGSNVSNDHDHSRVKYYENIQVMTVGTKVAFKINVPVAGYYNIVHDIVNATASDKYAKRKNTDVGVYVSKDGIDVSLASYIGKVNLYSDDYDQGEKRQATSGMVKFDEPGSYILTFKVDKSNQGASDAFSAIYSFYLVGGTKDALMNGKITSSVSSINVDDGETAEVIATGYLSSTTEAATFTYSSSNEKVATVDAESGVVTPVSEGKATITATANADLVNTLSTEIIVTCNKPGEAIEDTKINFTAFAEEGGTVTDDKLVKEVAIGSNVTVEATANEGYEFAYWRNASGKHLSSNATETFKVNTNTAVIAVFDKVKVEEGDTTAPVYFYNENGSLIEKKDVALGSTFADAIKGIETNLTGFTFREWSISGDTIINKILRAVALYDKNETVYNVTVGGNVVASGKYGEEVTVTGSDSFVAWKLGNNIVSYDKEYTFYIWGDITLTEVTEGEATVAPTVAISNIGDNYFIAYDVPAGYTLVEAGIVFADTGMPEVGSFYSKAIAKTGSGQFTAKKGDGTETVARGYVMFRDSVNSIRVIYAD